MHNRSWYKEQGVRCDDRTGRIIVSPYTGDRFISNLVIAFVIVAFAYVSYAAGHVGHGNAYVFATACLLAGMILTASHLVVFDVRENTVRRRTALLGIPVIQRTVRFEDVERVEVDAKLDENLWKHLVRIRSQCGRAISVKVFSSAAGDEQWERKVWSFAQMLADEMGTEMVVNSRALS